MDLYGNAKRRQRLSELLKKLSYRNGPERYLADLSVARTADQFVRHKIKFGVEQNPSICGHCRCCESARREIKRDIPPVVLYRRQRQTGLADNLHIHVQRFGGVLPLFTLEWRPLAEIG
jgi:hypothetical protein